jgi:putative ABC transport system substrate-binding protein
VISRREIVGGLTASAALWPLAARAQQPAMPVIGYLSSTSEEAYILAAFRRGLSEQGYEEGRNLRIEYRYASGEYDRLPALAAELASLPVAVIVTLPSSPAALAAKAATAKIPITFALGVDPIKLGPVASYNLPGGNVTGVSMFAGTIDAKRLELLRQLVPHAQTVAVLNNVLVAETEARSKSLGDAAKMLDLRLVFFNVSSEAEFDPAFRTITEQKIDAAFVSGSPFFISRRNQLVQSAAAHRVPTIYAWREIAVTGGLISYGADVLDSARQGGIYVGRILKGEKPGDLPVLQPTKFEMVINLKTARALGLTVPQALLATAGEVIE